MAKICLRADAQQQQSANAIAPSRRPLQSEGPLGQSGTLSQHACQTPVVPAAPLFSATFRQYPASRSCVPANWDPSRSIEYEEDTEYFGALQPETCMYLYFGIRFLVATQTAAARRSNVLTAAPCSSSSDSSGSFDLRLEKDGCRIFSQRATSSACEGFGLVAADQATPPVLPSHLHLTKVHYVAHCSLAKDQHHLRSLDVAFVSLVLVTFHPPLVLGLSFRTCVFSANFGTMGFMSHRQKNVELRPEQKWDYITLNDFKSTSCLTPLAYGYLYLSLLLSTAVYAVDTFTAVNLLVFNKWSSEISPAISFTAAKWIFSVCIILSFLNLAYEHIRAQLVMRRGSVTECYLDNLAVRLESIRWGKGQGWKRFLVIAALTKSKKGSEYIALFTYFSFQSWIRILLCSGPRQVVNALTLYSVYNAKLFVTGDNVANTLKNFFEKIRELAEENSQQALILSSMLFTLIIWIFSFLSLLIAFLFFAFYLWSYIPKSDGSLSAYCSRKINKRLMQIVSVKVNAALAEEERRRKKAGFKAAKKAGELPPAEQKATIPNVGFNSPPSLPKMERTDTMATLPPYTSQPATPGGYGLGAIDQKRPMPSRSGTLPSSVPPGNGNFSTRASLLRFAAEPGMGNVRSASPAPSIPNLTGMRDSELNNGYPRPPMRSATEAPNFSYRGGSATPPRQLNRTNTAGSMAPASNGSFSNMPQRVQSPAPYASRQQQYNNGPSIPNHRSNGSNGSNSSNRFAAYQDETGRSSPAPSVRAYGPGGGFNAPSQYNTNFSASPQGMPARMRSATNPVQRRVSQSGTGFGQVPFKQSFAPQRNMTAPLPSYEHQRQDSNESYASYFESPAAAPVQWSFAPQRGMTAPVPSYAHLRQDSNESYASYFESPAAAPVQRSFAPQRGMTAPVPSYAHLRQDSNESYASYFELPAPAPTQQPSQSRPAYGNNSWNTDVESQNGPGRY
ncbi:hypothetical protein CMQ_6283 [Grosmannia clavigera kw1407]|uniref:Pheromone-regulated membrane protein n=1 Tax=Grosmannia clavigera (strain kw1407 / UAMH 11150) TaxID=655863 RepID=F0XM36_GROCL|nr:uncharacterized protein CMQ_6283 [Grosmannia clavigera kw1407]EFX01341.1 hypothetical protein CMQ_6283 [Grosmannia clavigera kw1407]